MNGTRHHAWKNSAAALAAGILITSCSAPAAPPKPETSAPPTASAPPFFDRFSGSYLSWGNVLDNNLLSSSSIEAESDYYAMGVSFTPTFFA